MYDLFVTWSKSGGERGIPRVTCSALEASQVRTPSCRNSNRTKVAERGGFPVLFVRPLRPHRFEPPLVGIQTEQKWRREGDSNPRYNFWVV